MASSEHTVVVIGAGPVGLFTALLLAKGGVKVTLYESGEGIDQSPRAVGYFPPTLEEFAKAGIIQDVIEAGDVVSDGCAWRNSKGDVLASIAPPSDDKSFAAVLSQPELGAILLKKLLETGNAEVRFNESLMRLEQNDDAVTYWTVGKASAEEVEHQCQYLVGADGGRSKVRRTVGIEFEGFTFDNLQFVAVNFQYPVSELGWKKANYIVDPVDWGVVIKRGKGSRWRFATGFRKAENLTVLDKTTIQAVKDRLGRLLPGDTSQIQYEGMAPYLVHHRCASRFQKRRVLLAGDAAHLNNPIGGLGLTTGLLDAAHLAKALKQVLNGGLDTNVLATYAETRRRVFLEKTNPISLANLRRLHSDDPEVTKQREEEFAHINNPKDFINTIRLGLPDFALTSTSDRIFDTQSEVTWFISVSKIPEWTDEKFVHEYKTVHADMARQKSDQVTPIKRYIQLSSSPISIEGAERPSWNYVTCLTWPSLFIVHAGFSNPGYKATAGAHVFCRLDQVGSLAQQVVKYSKENPSEKSDVEAAQCLIFHKRSSASDEYPEKWFTDRAAKWRDVEASDDRLRTYILYRDVTPKDTEYFFRDTQFTKGSWNEYKAVEAFYFKDETDSTAFLQQHGKEVVEGAVGETQAVVGVPDIIV
ncbi:hypothetical protein ACHAO1_011165 [Botrytis cinerea]